MEEDVSSQIHVISVSRLRVEKEEEECRCPDFL